MTPTQQQAFTASLPKGRLIAPSEMAGIIVFLASAYSTPLHGAVIDASMGLGVRPGLITEHGKEGPKKLLVVDAFPYFVKWFDNHPEKGCDAFLFLNERGGQLNPWAANKKIKAARKRLGIKKPITNYSLKRSGVTLRRQRGDSDTTIQHIAGWTSTKQLKTYDLTAQDDIFNIELAKRGIIKDPQYKKYAPKTKKCPFCETDNGFAQEMCSTCKRPLDREKIRETMGETETKAVDQFLNTSEMRWLFKTVRKLDKLLD